MIAPNGMEVTFYMCNPDGSPGVFLECESARHPDYKMPVQVVWSSEWNKLPREWELDYNIHAVIYFDGNIIVTAYEYRFFMWYARTGHAVDYKHLPDYMDQKHQIISEESRAELRRRYPPKER